MTKNFLHFITASAIFLFMLISCDHVAEKHAASSETKKAFDLSSVRSQFDSLNKVMGEELAKGDSAAMAAHYASDARVMPPNMPALSGDGIKAMWGGFIRQGINLKLETTEVWGDEDLVAEEGKYTVLDKTGKAVDNGKYIVLWKMEDGKWKMFRDIFNSDAK